MFSAVVHGKVLTFLRYVEQSCGLSDATWSRISSWLSVSLAGTLLSDLIAKLRALIGYAVSSSLISSSDRAKPAVTPKRCATYSERRRHLLQGGALASLRLSSP